MFENRDKELYTLEDYRRKAETRLTKQAWDYYEGRANDGYTYS